MSGMVPPSQYSSRFGIYRFDCSVEEEGDEGDDEPQTSKSAGANVHIMTTKVQVSEDIKRVGSIFLAPTIST